MEFRGRAARVSVGDARERFADRIGRGGPNEAPDLMSVLQEDQRRPPLHMESASQPSATRVGDFDVAYTQMGLQCLADKWLCANAVTAPRATRFKQGRSRQRIYLRSRRLLLGVIFSLHHYSFTASSILTRDTSGKRAQLRFVLTAGMRVPCFFLKLIDRPNVHTMHGACASRTLEQPSALGSAFFFSEIAGLPEAYRNRRRRTEPPVQP